MSASPMFVRLQRVLGVSAMVVMGLAGIGCSEEIVQTQAPIGGSCLACHQGITDVHPFFALACVDCHGGNDQVPMPSVVNVRDQNLIKLSHVLALDPSMWWPNGIDDDGDDLIDESGEFFDGRALTGTGLPFASSRAANKGQMDSEMNRDINYLRFVNPGDLRVANVSCGAKNNNANAAMVCHAEIVYDNRRSIMAAHSGVPAGANYGNGQRPRAADFGDAFANSPFAAEFDARNKRIGRVGYVFDYDGMDAAFTGGPIDGTRNLVSGGFDHDALLVNAGANADPEDDKFEAQAGPIYDDGVTGASAKWDPGVGLTRTGTQLKFFTPGDPNNRAVTMLQAIPNRETRTWPPVGSSLELRVQLMLNVRNVSPLVNAFDADEISNPVDAALRVFRAYHSLNFWATSDNFGAVDFSTSPNAEDAAPPSPADVELRNNNNPFGRGRPSGCTSCHMEYAKNGANLEPEDITISGGDRQPDTDLPFGIRADLGQHFYPKRHQLKRTVTQETCGSCHGFVTRVDYAMGGTFEHETDFTNIEKLTTVATSFATSAGSTVNIFDNLAHYKNGVLLNDGEGFTEDLNGDGELQTALTESDINGDGWVQPNEDINKNGIIDDASVVFNEDTFIYGENCALNPRCSNGALDVPDRVQRSDSFDGRQSRIVYGGANGAQHLKDIHYERGFQCIDCHIGTDVHGDGNLYARNWDSVQVECDDCHGTNDAPPELVFSGPNGGDDMTNARYTTIFGKPWFERDGDNVVQNSRVFANLKWNVPRLNAPRTAASSYAHKQLLESGPERTTAECSVQTTEDSCIEARCSWDGQGSCVGFERKYAHVAERAEKGGLECYACHSSWQPNCLSCHLKMDVAKPKQEIWFGDDDVEDIFFQLFSYTRSPYILGHAGNVEGNKIAPHRSTMQVMLTIAAGNTQLVESAAFSTEGNLSSMASNPFFPHTVRTTETKTCARCHTLKDDGERVENDHLITEATGQGSGRYSNLTDWAVVATANSMDLVDVKKEVGGTLTFPGFDFDDAVNNRRVTLAFGEVFDVAVNRGVSFQNGSGDVYDLALVAHSAGLSVVDFFGRDNAGYPPTELARIDTLGKVRSVDVVESAASQTTRFVAITDEELVVGDYRAALNLQIASPLIAPDAGTGADGDPDFEVVDAGPDQLLQGMVIVGSLPHGLRNVVRVRLHGGYAIVAHGDGISVFRLAASGNDTEVDLGAPLVEVTRLETTRPALDVVTSGRFAYVACGEGGVEVFDIGPFTQSLLDAQSTTRIAVALTDQQQPADSRGVAVFGSRLLVADGRNGLRVLDVAVPADPVLEQTILTLDNGQRIDQASVVVVATEPARTFAVVGSGSAVHAINLTSITDVRTRFADIQADMLSGGTDTRGLRLANERADPLTPFDPKNVVRQTFTFPTTAPVRALARGINFDNIADKGGRRLRDNWSLGSRPLSNDMASRMRNVTVKEVPNSVDPRGDGLGCVVRDTDLAASRQEGKTCIPPAL